MTKLQRDEDCFSDDSYSIRHEAADEACGKIYPDATPQTINRQFYTPLIAVKNYAGDKIEIKRPIGGIKR